MKSLPKPSYLLNSTSRFLVGADGAAVSTAATPTADDDEDDRDDALMVRPLLDVVVQARVRELDEARTEKRRIVGLIMLLLNIGKLEGTKTLDARNELGRAGR
jgi:hypothetical protein